MDFQAYTFPVPDGALNLDALHAALDAANIGLDGVSVQGNSIIVCASSDPSKAFASVDWTPVLAPMVDPLNAKLAELTSAISVALTGTDADKSAAAAQLADAPMRISPLPLGSLHG